MAFSSFTRNGKGIVLTDTGGRLLEYAEQIATIADAARKELALLKVAELRVGASMAAREEFRSDLLLTFECISTFAAPVYGTAAKT